MKKLLSFVPNAITSLNLFSGCIAIVLLLEGKYLESVGFIIIALIADFLDGFIARLLQVSSKLGKELDSLSDLISFGFYPGIIAFSALKQLSIDGPLSNVLPYLAFLITVASAIRLGRFNLDENQSSEFIGLPTPANTLLWLFFPLLWAFGSSNKIVIELTNHPLFIAFLVVFSSIILNAPVRLIALKFKSYRFADSWDKYLLLIFSCALIAIFRFLASPFIITLYLLISWVKNQLNKKVKH